ncbi:ribonuclease III [Marinagarivorans algicola]|uniref:ribonuclease III n=1 Tax=Marinagarivorans algicola TaxID=1513270 RepID=UPI000B336855|nr:ribonuclease III [Marinagarivorans algicola]
MKNINLERLQRQLGYEFVNVELLNTALTHRSFCAKHNERLEFLGDSILNFTIAEALFEQFPNAREGQLSRLRALMVKGETLAEIAREFNIGDTLNLGEGELKSGGFRRASILADAVEAIIGAVYFDTAMNMEAVKALILRWFTSRLKNIQLETTSAKDAKSILQEWLQGRKKDLPSYDIVKVEGDLHDQIYTVSCRVPVTHEVTQGAASNRKTAEKIAAEAMLQKLKIG